jgi:hypothetical protein
MEKVLIIKIAKRIALNFYRCFADITIATEKANLSREAGRKANSPAMKRGWFPDKWIC